MPSPQEERERLAAAIADGARIDWEAVVAEGVLTPQEIATLRRLDDLRGAQLFPAAETNEAGKLVGDFLLVRQIGQGGMGQVWEAEQLSLRRRVALKFVRPERVTKRQLELFAREARAGGRLSHPGVVGVHAHGVSDGLAWIAMELVPGGRTLRSFVDEIARLPQVPGGYDEEVARLVAEIADDPPGFLGHRS